MNEQKKMAFKILAGTLAMLGLAWQQTQATRLGYKVERARHQARIIRGRLGALQVQLEKSLSPAELAMRAKAMGMIQSDPESLRVLEGAENPPEHRTFLSRLFPKSWRTLLNT